MGWRWVAREQRGVLEPLRSIGFPVDLLPFFAAEGADPADPFMVVLDVTRMLGGDGVAEDVLPELAARPFRFFKSRPDFRVATESGEYDAAVLRLQIPTDHYYQGVGDGGSIDLVRQLAAALPDASLVISIKHEHVDAFLAIARTWDSAGSSARQGATNRMTVLPEPLPVSQWAQDNGKVGFIARSAGASPAPTDSTKAADEAPALLAPRYASRREEVSAFIPGDTFLLDSLAAAGVTIIHSPLLFQGGDLIAVRDPATGRRTLLIGEADIYRNTALGLSAEQVVEAFRQEFGVDECVVFPAISYHIDYEVSVRAAGGRLVAFVNDSDAASRIVLVAGLSVLERNRLVEANIAARAREAFNAGRIDPLLDLIESVLVKRSVGYGQFPESFAALFAEGPSDSGVGNLQRFLLALDTLAFAGSPPRWKAGDPHGAAYANTLRRREEDRAAFRDQLRGRGWKVVAVPSTSEADRSLNYLNGVHLRGAYLMPAYGGLFGDLDRAAAAVFSAELGPQVPVVPILCGESQRRVGAVRCSVCVFPAVNRGP
jgi:hypothetical protein